MARRSSQMKLSQNPHALRDSAEKNLEVAIGRAVRELRKRQRMTGADLATQTGLSVGMLSKIENGVISSSLGTLQALETIKLLSGMATPRNTLRLFDARTSNWRALALQRSRSCPVCGGRHADLV